MSRPGGGVTGLDRTSSEACQAVELRMPRRRPPAARKWASSTDATASPSIRSAMATMAAQARMGP